MPEIYVEVGALWENEKGTSGKLSNGMAVYQSPNKYKEEGDNKPSLKLRMRLEDAKALGIEPKEPKEIPQTPF